MYSHLHHASVDGEDVVRAERFGHDGHVSKRAVLAEVGCAHAALQLADDTGDHQVAIQRHA